MSVFADEWRDCLRAQYLHVIRAGDGRTQASLEVVMAEAGFGSDELRDLYVQATAHVDHIPADFVPDVARLERGADAAEPRPAASPTEAPPEAEIEADNPADSAFDDDNDDDENAPDGTEQMSLF